MRTRFWLAVAGIVLLLTFLLGSVARAETQAGSTGRKLAVTPVGYDDMGSVLKKLGITPDEITYEQAASLAELEKYDAFYINCAGEAEGASDEVVSAIKEYVKNGGVVYASDFAGGIISKAFPGKINFYKGYDTGTGNDISSAHVGATGDVTAKVVDSGLASVLGKTSVTINYDLPAWVVVDSAGAGTRVLMTGDVPITSYDLSSAESAKTLKDRPMVLSFSEGKGEVLYTTFHNEAQLTKDVEAIVSWFGVRTKASKLLTATRNLVVEGDNIALQEIVDSINKGDTKTYYFNATGKEDFKITLNFGGSTLALSITDPDGKKVASQDVSKPPFTTSVPAKEGKFKIELEGKDVPEQNYSFVILASGPRDAAADEIIVGQATTSSGGAETATSLWQRILHGAYWAIGIGAVVVVLIIVLVIVLIARASRKKKAAAPAAEVKTAPAAPEAKTEEKKE